MPSAPANSLTVAAFVAPGAGDTYANGINGAGQIVGSYKDCEDHGFLRSAAGAFTTIDVPSAPPQPGAPGAYTEANGINDAGQIVGSFYDATGKRHGYLRTARGTFTMIDVPGATDTEAFGINDAGQIVGSFYDATGKRHGYLGTPGGVFTTIDVPGTIDTQTSGINSGGEIVGFFDKGGGYQGCPGCAKRHGYLRTRGGNFTTIDVPAAIGTEASGINDAGWIVGSFYEAGGKHHSFLRTPGGIFTTIDYTAPSPTPGLMTACTAATGSGDSYARGINNAGQIVGNFIGDYSKNYGYVATPNR